MSIVAAQESKAGISLETSVVSVGRLGDPVHIAHNPVSLNYTSVLTFTPAFTMYLPLVASNYCSPLYFDDFSDSGSGWPIGSETYGRYEYVNDEYHIEAYLDYWAGASPDFQASDYIVAADVRYNGEEDDYSSYGLIFGLSGDWSQFYTFEIEPDGYWAIWRYSSDEWTFLTGGLSGSINTGAATNQLKIERNGSLISAYVNGQLLTSVSDSTYLGSRYVGLIVSSSSYYGADAYFDNFTVYHVSCGAGTTAFSEACRISDNGVMEAKLLTNWANGPNHKDR